jgi:hypothetical protein
MKGWQDVVCTYCGGKWPSKLKILEHQHKGCKIAPFYLDSSKQVRLPIYPNFKFVQETNKLKQMLINEKGFSHLPLKTRT